MADPEVALIVSTYKRHYHLRRCLLAIPLQVGVHNSMEVVVTDDGASDLTLNVVREFASFVNFPVWYTTHPHSGFQLARCRNEGVLATTAPYLIFLDGDLLIPPDFVALHLKHRLLRTAIVGDSCWLDEETSQRITESEVVAGDYARWASESERRRIRRKAWRAALYCRFGVPNRPRMKGGNVALWRDDFQRINGYDQDFVGWGLEDTDLQKRLAQCGVRFQSSMSWTVTYHISHTRDPSYVPKARGTKNEAMLIQRVRPSVCRNGLVQKNEHRVIEMNGYAQSYQTASNGTSVVANLSEGSGSVEQRLAGLPKVLGELQSLHDYFDHVVCISLPSRDDRWEEICGQLKSAEWPFRMPHRFSAIDGHICRPPGWMQNRYPECESAWGCYQSHLRVLENALMNKVGKLLILEDDAVFVPGFCDGVAEFLGRVPSEWDHLFLGGEHMIDPVKEAEGVYRCRQVHRTHAHALQGEFIRQAYEMLVSYPTIDHYRRRRFGGLGQYLSRIIRRPKSIWSSSASDRSAHVDHHFGAMHRSGQFNVYAPRTWLVGQAAGRSDIVQGHVAETFWHQT